MMQATPIEATELPPADAPHELHVERALNMISNTAPFDITDHRRGRALRHVRPAAGVLHLSESRSCPGRGEEPE